MAHWQAPGRSTVAPFLIAKNPDAVITFAVQVFGAELSRPVLRKSDGSLWNAELRIGDSTILLGAGGEGFSQPGFVHVYVPDADEAHARALEAGATTMMPVEDQFYGDRAGGVTDPQGNLWWIATHQRHLDDDALEAAARQEETRRTH